jgi:uncharacterized membrane protein
LKRLFWLGLGVGAGVVGARKATQAAGKLTPAGMTEGLASSIGNLGDAIREFGQDVRDAMWDREEELREALGLNEPALDDAALDAKRGSRARNEHGCPAEQ